MTVFYRKICSELKEIEKYSFCLFSFLYFAKYLYSLETSEYLKQRNRFEF